MLLEKQLHGEIRIRFYFAQYRKTSIYKISGIQSLLFHTHVKWNMYKWKIWNSSKNFVLFLEQEPMLLDPSIFQVFHTRSITWTASAITIATEDITVANATIEMCHLSTIFTKLCIAFRSSDFVFFLHPIFIAINKLANFM